MRRLGFTSSKISMTSLEIRFLGLILEKHRNNVDPLSNCLGHPLSNFNFVTMSRCDEK